MAGEKIDQIQSIDKLKEKTIGVFSKLAADYDKHIKNDFSWTDIGNKKNELIQTAVPMAIQAINDNEIDKANQIIIKLERLIREIHNESPNRAGKYEDSQSYQLIEKLKTEFGDYTTQLDAEISRIRLKQEVLHRLLISVEDWAVPAASKIEPEKLTTKGEIVKDLEKVERILSGINQAIVSNAKALELNIPGISSEVIEEAKGASLNISQKKQALEARLLKIQEDAINKIKIAQLEINHHLTELRSKLEGLAPTESDSAEDIVKTLQLLQKFENNLNEVYQQSSEKKAELDKTADDAGLNDEQKLRLNSLEAVKLDVESTKENLNLHIKSLKNSAVKAKEPLEQAVSLLNSKINTIEPNKLTDISKIEELKIDLSKLEENVKTARTEYTLKADMTKVFGVMDPELFTTNFVANNAQTNAYRKQEELIERISTIQAATAAVALAQDKLNTTVRAFDEGLGAINPATLDNKAGVEAAQLEIQRLQGAVATAVQAAAEANAQAAAGGVDVSVDVAAATQALDATIKAKERELNTRMKDIQRQAKTLIDNAQTELNTKMVNLIEETDKLNPTSSDTAATIESKISTLAELENSFDTIKQGAEAKNIELDQIAKDAGIENRFTLASLGMADGNNTNIETTKLLLTIKLATKEVAEAQEKLDKAVDALNTKLKTEPKTLNTPSAVQAIQQEIQTLKGEVEEAVKEAKAANEKATAVEVDGVNMTTANQVLESITLINQALLLRNDEIITTTDLVNQTQKKLNEACKKYDMYNYEKLVSFIADMNSGGKTSSEIIAVQKEMGAFKQKILTEMENAGPVNEIAEAAKVYTVFMINPEQSLFSIRDREDVLESGLKKAQAKEAVVVAQDKLNTAVKALNEGLGAIKPAQLKDAAEIEAAKKTISDLQQIYENSLEQSGIKTAIKQYKSAFVYYDGVEPKQSEIIVQPTIKALEEKLTTIKFVATQAVNAARVKLNTAVKALDEGLDAIKPAALKNASEVEAAKKSITNLQETYENSLKLSEIDAANDLAKAAGVREVNIGIINSVPEKILLRLKALDTELQIMQNTAKSSEISLKEAIASLNTKIAKIKPNELKTVDLADQKIAELRSEKDTLKRLLGDYTEKAEAAGITDQNFVKSTEEVINNNKAQQSLGDRKVLISHAISTLKTAKQELKDCQDKLDATADQIKPEKLTTASNVETQINLLGGLKTELETAQKKAKDANTNAEKTNIDARIDTNIDTTHYDTAIQKLNARLELIGQITQSVQETQQNLNQAFERLNSAIQIDPKTFSSPESVQAQQGNIAQLTQTLNTAKEAAVTAKTSAAKNNINTQTYAEVLVNSQKTLDDSVQQILVQATAKQQDLDSRQKVIGALLAEIGKAHNQFNLQTEALNNSLGRTQGQTFTSVDAIQSKTLALQESLQNVMKAKGSTQQLLDIAQSSNIETNVSTDTTQIEARVTAQIIELEQQTTTMQETAKQAINSANKDLNSKAQKLKEDVQAIPTELNSVAEIKQTLISLEAAQKSASDLKDEANRSDTELNFQARNANINDRISIPDTETLSQDIQSKITALETKEKDIKQQALQAKQTLDKAVDALKMIPVASLSSLQQIEQEKIKLATANQALQDYTEKAELADSSVNTTDISTTIQKFDGALNTKSEQITQAEADAKQILDAAVQGINTKINAIKPETLKIDDVKSKTDELNGDSSKLQELLRDYTQKAEAAGVDPNAEAEAVTQTLGGISLKQKAIFTQKISLELSAHGAQSNLDKAIEELKQITGENIEGLKVDGLEQRIRKIAKAQQNVTDSVKNCKAVSESTGIPIDTSKANPSEADKIKEKIQASIQTIKEAASEKVSTHQAALDGLEKTLNQPNEPFTTAQEIKDEQDRLQQLMANAKLPIATAEQINIEAGDAKIGGVNTKPVTEALIAAQTKLQDLTAQSEQITQTAVEAQDKLNQALTSLNEKITEIKPNELKTVDLADQKIAELRSEKDTLKRLLGDYTEKAEAAGITDQNFVKSTEEVINNNKAQQSLGDRKVLISHAISTLKTAKQELKDCQDKLDATADQIKPEKLTTASNVETQINLLGGLKTELETAQKKAKDANTNAEKTNIDARIDTNIDTTHYDTAIQKLNARLELIGQITQSVQETQQNLNQAFERLNSAIQIDPKTFSSPESVQAQQGNIAQLTQTLNTAKEAAVTAKTSAAKNNINTQTYAEVLVNSQKTLDDSVQQILVQATAKQQDLDSRQKVIGALLAEIGKAHNQFNLQTEALNNSLGRTQGQTFTSVDAIQSKTLALQESLQNVMKAKGSTQQLLDIAQSSNIETNVSTDTTQIEARVTAQIIELEQQTTTMQETAKQAINSANKDLNSKAQKLKEDVQAIPTELNSVAEIKQTLISLEAAQKSASDLKDEANRSDTELNFQARNANINDRISIPDTETLSQDIQSKITALETKEKDIKQQALQAKQTLDKAVDALKMIPVASLSSLQQIEQEKIKLATANQALQDYTEKAELADSSVNTTDISTTIQKFDGALNTKSEQITQAEADAKQILDAAVQGINTKINAIKPETLKIDDVKSKTDELNGDSSKLQELLRDYTQKAEAAGVDPNAEAEAVTQTLGGISLKQKAIFTQKISLELSAHGAQSNLDKAIEELKQITGENIEGLKVDGLEQRIRKIAKAQQNVTDSVKNCKAVSESTGIPIDTSKANPSEADKIKEKIQASIQTIKEAASEKVSTHQAALDGLEKTLNQPNEPFTTAQEIKDEQDRLQQLMANAKLPIATAEQINIEAGDAKIGGVNTKPVTEALIAAQTKLQDLTAQFEQITKAAVEAKDKLNQALTSLYQKIAEIQSNKSSDIPTYEKLRNELSACSKQLESAQVEFKSKADATKISGAMDLSLSSSMSSASSAQTEAKNILENLSQRIITINAINDAQKNLNQDIETNLNRIPEPATIRNLPNVKEIQSQLDELEKLKTDIIALEDKAKLTNDELNKQASGASIQNTFDMSSFKLIEANIKISSKRLKTKKDAFIATALTATETLDNKVEEINQVIKGLPNPITESNQIIQAKKQLSSLEKEVQAQFKEFEKLTNPAVGDEPTTQKIDTSKASYSSAIAKLEQTIQILDKKELEIQTNASKSLKTLKLKITDSQELIAKIENLSDPKHAKIDKLTLENYLKDLQELSRELPKMLSSAENDAKNANQPSLDDQAKMVADFKSKISEYEIIINQQLKILQLSEQLSTPHAFQQQNPTRINPLHSNTQSSVNSAEPISQSPFKGFNIFSRYKEQLDTQKEQNTPLVSINFQESVDLKDLELFKKEGGVTLTVPTTNHTFQFRHDGKHDAQAILTREGAGIGKEPIADLKDDQRKNIGLDVINMIENVLAKGNNLHFKTSDPYVAEFAKQYVDDLKRKGLTINASIEGPKTQQPANTDVATKATDDFNKIKAEFSYDKDFANRAWVKEHKESAKNIQENVQKASPSRT